MQLGVQAGLVSLFINKHPKRLPKLVSKIRIWSIWRRIASERPQKQSKNQTAIMDLMLLYYFWFSALIIVRLGIIFGQNYKKIKKQHSKSVDSFYPFFRKTSIIQRWVILVSEKYIRKNRLY